MSQNLFPKVLIIGQSFNSISGGGITLSNLFKGWPLDHIAVATYNVDSEGLNYCNNYYKFGNDEDIRPWPYRMKQLKDSSGPINVKLFKSISPEQNSRIETDKNASLLKKFSHLLRDFIGLSPWIYRLNISESFLSWFDNFQPDIVYTQLSNFKSINFISQLIGTRKIPLVIHIMDDWPSTLYEPGILHYYWKYRVNQGFKSLIEYSTVRMSICKAMSDEYLLRYNKNFIPFHNTIDIKVWEKVAKMDWTINNEFRVLYAGRIGRGTFNSILSIANAVEELGVEGFKIVFELQTKSLPEKFEEQISQLNFTRKAEFISYEKLPRKFAEVDLLVLPMDYDEYNLRFIKFSMPTKVPEYLASGTPILVFASNETALAKYAEELNWAQVVSENNILMIKDALIKLYNSIERRTELGNIGKTVAKMNHDGLKVRNEFRLNMIEAAEFKL